MDPRPLTDAEYDAIDEAYRANSKAIAYHVSKYLHTKDLCEECIQRTFERAIANIDKFMASENRVGWLIITSANIAKELLREEKRNAHVQYDDLVRSYSMSFTVSDPEGRQKIIALIGGRLSRKNREFFGIVMENIGKSDADLAQMLGISESAVRGRWKRLTDAVRELPESVKNYFEFL